MGAQGVVRLQAVSDRLFVDEASGVIAFVAGEDAAPRCGVGFGAPCSPVFFSPGVFECRCAALWQGVGCGGDVVRGAVRVLGLFGPAPGVEGAAFEAGEE